MKIYCPNCDKEMMYEWTRHIVSSFDAGEDLYKCEECGRRLAVRELEGED